MVPADRVAAIVWLGVSFVLAMVGIWLVGKIRR